MIMYSSSIIIHCPVQELKVTYGINEVGGGAEVAQGIQHAKNAQRDLLRRYPCSVPTLQYDPS